MTKYVLYLIVAALLAIQSASSQTVINGSRQIVGGGLDAGKATYTRLTTGVGAPDSSLCNTAKAITAATSASPPVLTSNSHGFNNGDIVIVYGAIVGGMSGLTGTFMVGSATTNTFALCGNWDGTTCQNPPTTSGTYTSGAFSSRHVGREYFRQDSTAGQNKYYCTDSSGSPTWTQQSGGGGSPTGGTGISVSGSAVSLHPTSADRAWMQDYFCFNQANSGYLGTHGWNFGGTLNHAASVANHPCGVSIVEANTGGALAYVYLGNGPEKIIPPLSTIGSGEFVFGFKTPSNITNKDIRVGLRQTPGATAEATTNIAEVRYSNSASGCTTTHTDSTWQYILEDGTTLDAAAGPAIATSTVYWLRIKYTSAGHISFNLVGDGVAWASGTEVEVNTSTHIPIGALTPHFSIQNCDGANANDLGVLFFAFDLPMAGPQ